MKRFALGSTFSLRDREFLGLRGWDGKPLHPPLTDLPIGAYIIAFLMDGGSLIGGDRGWSGDLHVAAGYTFLFGQAFGLLTSLTGFIDWLRMRPGSEVRRITNTHFLSMVVVTAMVAANLLWRWNDDAERTEAALFVLSAAIAGVVTFGAAIGGSLVFDKGYRVRKAKAAAQAAPGNTGNAG